MTRLGQLARRADEWGTGRRAALIAALLAVLVATAAAARLAAPWFLAAAFFSDVVVIHSSVRPLTWVTGEPQRLWVQWGEDGRGQLTLPAGEEPAPTMVLMLGAIPAAVDDPRVVRLTDALARTGFAVLLPLSASLDRGEVTPGEVDRLVEAVLAAPHHPRARADRLVLVGLSVGGSLALRAAADGRIAHDLDAVLALGPYYRAADMLEPAPVPRSPSLRRRCRPRRSPGCPA